MMDVIKNWTTDQMSVRFGFVLLTMSECKTLRLMIREGYLGGAHKLYLFKRGMDRLFLKICTVP